MSLPGEGLNPPIEVGRGYAFEALQAVVESEAWQALKPNMATSQDLRPQELSAAAIDRIVGELLNDEAIAAGMTDLVAEIGLFGETAFQYCKIPGVGVLTRVGYGESKICYQLSTDEGRVMAVQLRSYDPSIGIQVPDDPHLSLVRDGHYQRLWEYADPRTYLHLPLKGYYGVSFQEWAGEPATVWSAFLPVLGCRVLNYLRRSGGQFDLTLASTKNELAHGRHYLRKPGRSGFVILGIPVAERRW